jgi:hypothetical protein
VNNRELAFSPGRVRETDGFGIETINVHHSPLRSRPTSQKRPARIYSVKSTERDRSKSIGRKDKSQKKRKNTRSKSKSMSRTPTSAKAKGATQVSNLQKEF